VEERLTYRIYVFTLRMTPYGGEETNNTPKENVLSPEKGEPNQLNRTRGWEKRNRAVGGSWDRSTPPITKMQQQTRLHKQVRPKNRGKKLAENKELHSTKCLKLKCPRRRWKKEKESELFCQGGNTKTKKKKARRRQATKQHRRHLKTTA